MALNNLKVAQAFRHTPQAQELDLQKSSTNALRKSYGCNGEA
jgi:hypothetical protein